MLGNQGQGSPGFGDCNSLGVSFCFRLSGVTQGLSGWRWGWSVQSSHAGPGRGPLEPPGSLPVLLASLSPVQGSDRGSSARALGSLSPAFAEAANPQTHQVGSGRSHAEAGVGRFGGAALIASGAQHVWMSPWVRVQSCWMWTEISLRQSPQLSALSVLDLADNWRYDLVPLKVLEKGAWRGFWNGGSGSGG